MALASAALFIGALLAAPGLSAQETGTITGRVTDATTVQPLASAQVSIPALGIGALTQQNGRFILVNVPAGTHEVAVQRIGYRPGTQAVTVVAGQSVNVDFEIAEEALALDEIIVTGTPGGTQRRAIGNAVAQVEAAQITERQAIANVEDLISARTPGVNFQTNSGNVGSGSPIQIRGVSSLALGAQPLIYVDGVRIDNSAERGPEGGRSTGTASSLNDFNPQDIESIEIIKGPAAATLYGTEASAGVIQIITKKGISGDPEFTFSMRQGANFMQDPGEVIGTKYRCLDDDFEIEGAPGSPCMEEGIVSFNPYDVANQWVRETGWGGGRDALFRTGHAQGYNLSVRGGTDQVRYFLSGDYTDDQGIVYWNQDEALRLRGNVSVLMSEDFTIDVSTGYTQGLTRFEDVPGEGGVFHELVWSRSYIPGNPEKDALSNVFGERLPTAYENVQSLRDYTRFTGSVTANYNWNWLTQRMIVGLDKSWDTNTQLFPYDENGKFPGISFDPTTNTGGQITYARPVVTNATFDYAASGDWAPTDALTLTTSVGAQYYFEEEETLANTAGQFGTPLQNTLNQASPEDINLSFSDVQNKSLGVYVQEQIGWNDRIFLTGAIRADDNSAFGSEFDLEYYPKVSAAWVISEEPFWRLGAVNSLRLRGAWGKAGRQPSTFAGVTRYQAYAGPGGLPGISPLSPGNPLIGPEVSTEIELGFDVALLNDRVSGEFTYFDQTVHEALVEQGVAPSLGVPGDVNQNLGELAVWGWEAGLNARVWEIDNFAFDLTLSGDHTMNEIVSLGEGVVESANFQLGLPYPNVTGVHLESADYVSPGRYANAMCDRGVDGRPGGEIVPCNTLTDANLERDLLYGPAFPTHNFTVAPTVTLFNDLQVFAVADGEYGRWFADVQAHYSTFYQNTEQALLRTDPMFVAGYSLGDERYIGRVPADHWILREVGARYNLPQNLVQRMGVDRAALSLSGRDLWMMWQKSKVDLGGSTIVDVQLTGTTTETANSSLWTLPSTSSLSATLRVTF